MADLSSFLIGPPQGKLDPGAMQEALSQRQYDMYLERGVPLEDALIKYATDTKQPELVAAKAGQDTWDSYAGTSDMIKRRQSRYGIAPTARQTRTTNRLTNLDRATAISGAKNKARLDTNEDQVSWLGDLLGLGQNLNSRASYNLNSGAGMQAQRDQYNDAGKAADKQAYIGTAGTIAGLALSFL